MIILITITGIIIGIGIKGNQNPIDFYKNSMIDVLNDYRKGTIDYKEASSKIKSIGTKVKDVGDEKYETEGSLYSTIAANISYDLLHGDVSSSQIDKWIEKIKNP